MEQKRKYPKGYKPNIHLVSCNLRFCNNKYRTYVTHKDPKVRKQYQNKITTMPFRGVTLVLDDNHKFPTKKLKEEFISKLWRLGKIKMKKEDAMTSIKEVKIISSHGKVSYNFDEFKN